MTGPAEPPRRANSARRSEELAHARIRSLIHDAVAPLAARVEALEQRDGGGGVSDGHVAEHAELKATLDKLAAKAEDGAGESWFLPDLDPDTRAEREAELRAWVGEVLAVWHPRQARAVKDCWFQHPDARQAVQAAALAWHGAYRASGRRRTDPADWLARHLPALQKQATATWGADPTEPCEDHPTVRSPDHGVGVQPDLPGR